MNLQDFNSVQEIVPCRNPLTNKWVIGIDVGFSSVKAMSPNKRYCFPSFVKKIDGNLMSMNDDDIYYRDKDGVYLVGTKAQDLVRTDDTNDTNSSFDRNRYYTKDFIILIRTAIAIGLMDTEERRYDKQYRPFIQTGLPAAYLKEDAPKIRSSFLQPGSYELKLGSGKWMKFENNLKGEDVAVMSQPAGTMNSIMFDDEGNERPTAKAMMCKNLIIADFGFGTFDPYGVINRKKVLEESINNLGMKRVLEVASSYIYNDYHMDIRIPQMRKYMKDGYVKVVDIQNMISKRVPLDNYIERACMQVAEEATKKLYEVASYFNDYEVLIVTGGTGAAWFDFIKEKLSGMDGLDIISGNDGNSLPIYMANVRGYYMSAYRRHGSIK